MDEMNIPSIILLALIVIALVLVIIHIIRNGGCSACKGCNNCNNCKKAEKVKSKTYTERQSRSSAFYITLYQPSFVINLYPSDVFFTSK